MSRGAASGSAVAEGPATRETASREPAAPRTSAENDRPAGFSSTVRIPENLPARAPLPERAPVLLAGPTAVGKSAIALALAEALDGEILSVDSMQVYRGMDIGTAKPSAAERQRVPHHLLDLFDLSSACDAALYLRHAAAALEDLRRRGRRAICCGGTGLYFKALLEGLSPMPPADPPLRRELEAQPLEALLSELAQRDPATWASLDRSNRRRVVRALEILRLTGQPLAQQRAEAEASTQGVLPKSSLFVCLSRSSADLRRRIETRVEQMFRAGLVAETAALLAQGLAQNPVAMQALGYRQVVEHLRGVRSLEETIALVKTRTWQYARRQMTWFRHQARPVWLHLEPDTDARTAAAQVLQLLEQAGQGSTRLPDHRAAHPPSPVD